LFHITSVILLFFFYYFGHIALFLLFTSVILLFFFYYFVNIALFLQKFENVFSSIPNHQTPTTTI